MTTSIGISLGYNSVPESLDEISPPLFQIYSGFENIETVYHEAELELDGNRNWVSVGLDWLEIKFFRLSRAEFALLRTYDGEGSVRCLHQGTGEYIIRNCKFKPSLANQSGSFAHDALQGHAEAVLNCYDLEPQS